MLSYKLPAYEIRLHYPKHLEQSFVLALLLILSVFLVSRALPGARKVLNTPPAVELKSVDVPVTIQKKIPPPPLRPTMAVKDPSIDPDVMLPDELFDPIAMPDFPVPPRPLADEVIPWVAVESKPEIVGGAKALYQHIADHNLFPAFALRTGTSGIAQVEFVVGEDGTVRDAAVMDERPAGFGFGDAAVQAISAMRFTPGIQRDRAVAVRMSQVIRFKVE